MANKVKCRQCLTMRNASETKDGVCVDCLLEEGRNQVLYLMLCAGDEEVAHDNWHPDKAQFLYETRLKILSEIRHRERNMPADTRWPKKWPDFEKYTYTPG
jgi:hypothetical protein